MQSPPAYAVGMLRTALILIAACCFATGCGGYYIMSAPDTLAAQDEAAVAVARLQRNDFFVLAMAVPKAAIRFRVLPGDANPDNRTERGPLRAAHTDDLGYAGVHIPMVDAPVRNQPGKYQLRVAMLDAEGEEIVRVVPLYVWDPARAVVAVDLDSLPGGVLYASDEAVRAVRTLAANAHVIYLTRRDEPTMRRLHDRLESGGFPDGPILQWQRKHWHIVREGKFKIPRVKIETRLVSQLEDLVRQFPNLRVGVCNGDLAARAFVNLGMTCVVVNNPWLQGSQITHRKTWSGLADNPPAIPNP